MKDISGKEIRDNTIPPVKLNFTGFTPSNATDPLTKSFFEQYSNWKGECRIATISNIASISSASQATIQAACDTIGASTITLFVNDRILVKAQTNATENGIWIWNGTALTRDVTLNATSKFISASLSWVRTGDTFTSTFWWLTIPTGFSLGSSAVNWTKLLNQVSFFYATSNIQLTSLAANKGDFAFVGTSAPYTSYVLTTGDPTNLSNWVIVGSSSGGGSDFIGIPTDGQYGTSSSISGLAPGDRIEDAFDKIDTFLESIVPAKGNVLTSTNLVLTGTIYSGILPTGLNSAWYLYNTSGNTVNIITTSTYTLTTPNSSNSFRTGRSGINSTRGTLTSNLNGTTDLTLPLTSGSPPSNVSNSGGSLNWNSITTYNSIWSVSNASVIHTDASEGARKHEISHTEAGTSNSSLLYYDNTAGSPVFSIAANISELVPSFKLLSGIQYYGIGSTFQLTYTLASGIFQKTYHPTAVSSYSGSGFTTTNINPLSVPAYTDTFVVNQPITLNVSNISTGSINTSVSVTARKSNGNDTTSNASGLKRVCTYGIVSTNTSDSFFDEAKRLLVTSTSTYSGSSYNSASFDPNFDAQVRNGALQYPVALDYSPTTIPAGDKEYQRMFIVGVRSNGTINLGTLLASQVSAYGTGDVNILLRLDSATNYASTSGVIFDLGKSFGFNNGNGNADTRANSIGGQDGSTTSGNILGFTLGTFSTALSSNQFRLIIIFRNTNRTISQLVFI